MPLPNYSVRLTSNERAALNALLRTGTRAAAVLSHARIVLKADAGAAGPGWDEAQLVAAVEGGAATGYRVRQAFVAAGLPAALFRKKPTGRPYRQRAGAQEAPLLARACAAPPRGGPTGPGGCWPTDWLSWRWWGRAARKVFA